MSFLYSQNWKDFQRAAGRAVFDLSEENFVIKLNLPFGKSYLYSNCPDALKYLDEIKKIGKENNSIFFKYEPMLDKNKELTITNKGFKKSNKELQPQKTIVLDLNKSEDELITTMHKKHRYNIRLAQKRKIHVEESAKAEKDFEIFYNMLQSTAKQGNFNTHPKNYYKKLLQLDSVKLFIARKAHAEEHAAALVIFCNNTATYLHGASDYRHRRDMAPHLLHWEIIKRAKRDGYKHYDFWGIDEKRWPGVTRFKRGFEGEEIEYIGSWDLPLSTAWYNVYKIKNEISR